MIFRKKQKKEIGHVLKLFRVINKEDLAIYNSQLIINVIQLNLTTFFDNHPNSFNSLEVNYGNDINGKLETFFKILSDSSKTKEIVDLYLSHNESINIISYSNTLLNKIQQDGNELIELNVCFESEIATKKIISFVKELIRTFPVDYGYIFPYFENMEIDSEKFIKTSFFSSSVKNNEDQIQRRKRLLEIREGYYPKLYPINIFNKLQLNQLQSENQTIESTYTIDENLTLVIT